MVASSNVFNFSTTCGYRIKSIHLLIPSNPAAFESRRLLRISLELDGSAFSTIAENAITQSTGQTDRSNTIRAITPFLNTNRFFNRERLTASRQPDKFIQAEGTSIVAVCPGQTGGCEATGRWVGLPAAAERLVKLHEIQRNPLIALDQRILGGIKGPFGVQHMQKIRQAAFVELV